MKTLTFEKLKKLLKENNNIPEEANVDEDAEWYEGDPPRKWFYLGNCIDTVDEDEMWDANEMSNFLYQCDLFDIRKALPCLSTGRLPKELTNWLNKSKDKLDDLSEIVCGINASQFMGFIYISDFDTHYFFELEF